MNNLSFRVYVSFSLAISFFSLTYCGVRLFQTKFVIPNSSAGVIIGKSGSYIKELKERSGAHVNVSHKSDNPERIVTVSGRFSSHD